MSLSTAKALKSGILITGQIMQSFIIPIKITISVKYDKNYKFYETINRQIFYTLKRFLKRYTITFTRNSNNIPEIQMKLYFEALTQNDLSKKVKQAFTTIKKTMNELGLVITIINPREYLEELMETVPQEIIEITPTLFKIREMKGVNIISIIKLNIKTKESCNDLLILIRDFYSILTCGKINLDVISEYNEKGTKGTALATTVTLKTSNQEIIIKEQKKLNSILKIIGMKSSDNEQENRFITINELQKNYGKIMIGQGWKYNIIEDFNVINFANFFNILIEVD